MRQKTNKKVNLKIWNKPFKYTFAIESFEGGYDGLIASFIFAVGLSFIPAGVIVFVITEKIEGVKRS